MIDEEFESQMNQLASQLKQLDWKEDIFAAATSMIRSNATNEQLKGVTKLRRVLCTQRENVFSVAQDVIDSGAVPDLVSFLETNDKELVLGAAFCLTNIAAGHDAHTDVVVQAGAVQRLVALLCSEDESIRRQALFCLGNIAGSTELSRNIVMSIDAYFDNILYAVHASMDTKVCEIAAWNMRNVSVLSTYAPIESLVFFNNLGDVFNNNVVTRYALECFSASFDKCGNPAGLAAECEAFLLKTMPELIHIESHTSKKLALSVFLKTAQFNERIMWTIRSPPFLVDVAGDVHNFTVECRSTAMEILQILAKTRGPHFFDGDPTPISRLLVASKGPMLEDSIVRSMLALIAQCYDRLSIYDTPKYLSEDVLSAALKSIEMEIQNYEGPCEENLQVGFDVLQKALDVGETMKINSRLPSNPVSEIMRRQEVDKLIDQVLRTFLPHDVIVRAQSFMARIQNE